MSFPPEPDAAFGTAPGTAGGTAPPAAETGGLILPGVGLQKPRFGRLGFALPPVPTDGWDDRDDFVRTCIVMGLSAPQIAELSRSTPQPMQTHQQVYDKIDELHLTRLYTSRRIQRRRVGDHNKLIINV